MEATLQTDTDASVQAAPATCAALPARPAFTTERLAFVPLAPEHAGDLVSMQDDARVCEYLSDDVYTAHESALGLVRYSEQQHRERPGLGIWHVSARADGRFVGIFSLHYVPALKSVQLGVVFSRGGWGKRLVPDFGRAVLHYGFRYLGQSRLIALTDPGNRPAAFWLETYGFRKKADVLVGEVAQVLFVIDWATWNELHGSAGDEPFDWRAQAKRG